MTFMKYLKTLFLTAILAAFVINVSMTASAAAAGSTAGVVTTVSSPLTIRASASTDSPAVATLAKGSTVTLISKNGTWWYVEYAAGKYGYCYASYITQQNTSSAGYVSTSGGMLNIRSGPGTSYSVQAMLAKGTGLVVLSESDGWSRVLYNGTAIGYASSQYISAYGSAGGASTTYPQIKLAVPDYKQYDSRWANLKVGRSGKTIAAIGCVTTALAETESYRLGKSTITPATMLKQLTYNASGDVYWPSHYQKYTGSNYLGTVYTQLSQGKPVIFGAKTSSGRGHWVVVTGYTGGNSLTASGFLINDPGSATRKTLADLMKEYPYFYKLEYYY